jgi:hypothetical protein
MLPSTAATGCSSSPLSLMRTPVEGTGVWYGVRGGSIEVGSVNCRASGSPSCPYSHSPHTYTTPSRPCHAIGVAVARLTLVQSHEPKTSTATPNVNPTEKRCQDPPPPVGKLERSAQGSSRSYVPRGAAGV